MERDFVGYGDTPPVVPWPGGPAGRPGLRVVRMSIGLHCRIAGTPARSRAVVDFLEYAGRFPGVWFARRVDIARWWLQHQPPPATS